MPELPEVETIVQDLKKKILNKKIVSTQVLLKKMVKERTLKSFQQGLGGRELVDISRRGKLIIFTLSGKKEFLLVHLKMTGQLIYKAHNQLIIGGHSDEKINTHEAYQRYIHVIIQFEDLSELFFSDQRQFGYLKIVSGAEYKKILSKFGYEPLEPGFNLKKFKEILKNRKRNIKALLLDQSLIAGIGNIYADEILFAARVLPSRQSDTLTSTEIRDLHRHTRRILKKAIKYRGTTFNSYVDSDGQQGHFKKMLLVYQREGEICFNCQKEKIKKNKIAGRGTRFCPLCQH